VNTRTCVGKSAVFSLRRFIYSGGMRILDIYERKEIYVFHLRYA